MRLGMIAIAALASACTTGSAGAACIRHSDCTVGLTCGVDGICAVPPDAPQPDGGIDAVDIPDLPDALEDAAPEDVIDAGVAVDAGDEPDAF